MRKFSVVINGDKWKVEVLNYLEFSKRFPKASAVTVYNHTVKLREFYFSDDSITKGHVVHEVMHAFFSYRNFSKTSYGRMEEEICELLDDKMPQFTKTVNNIYHKIRNCRV